MKNRTRMAAALAAVSLCFTVFTIPTYAHGNDSTEETQTPVTATPAEPTAKPFTPAGEGTVIDNATNEEGKEFYTIKTPDENVFFLVIDRQRTGENVYFLNAVTEQDLMSLAKKDGKPKPTKSQPESEQKTSPETKPEQKPSATPEKKQSSGNLGTILLVLAIAAIGGGAGWYFKIYRPKHGIPELDEDEAELDNEDAIDEESGGFQDWDGEELDEGQEDDE